MNRSATIIATAVMLILAGSVAAREDVRLVSAPFHEVAPPAAAGAGEPFLSTAPRGDVYLSWVEPAGEGRHRMQFARWRGGAWGEAGTIAEGADWFVNWADVPSIAVRGDGRMAAHWLEKSGEGTYAYDVRVAQSFDAGRTWRRPVTPHRDGTPTEHGFASLFFDDDTLGVVWLDGRKYAADGASEETTLRAARVGAAGGLSGEVELDGRTCDCCPTSVAPTADGFLVAYRDRSPGEIRDISVVRYAGGKWGAPVTVANDGWKIDGCPVNGPGVASVGEKVVVAWFTMAGGRAEVRAEWSDDGGRTFHPHTRVDEGGAIGRVSVAAVGEGAAVTWLRRTGDDAEVCLRFVHPARPASRVHRIARTSAARSSGYPRVAAGGGSLLVVWTEPDEPARLRAAEAPLDAFGEGAADE
jgi:hypothetical protein